MACDGIVKKLLYEEDGFFADTFGKTEKIVILA
jgi:hypothetical protein